jgi:hypothetical protein
MPQLQNGDSGRCDCQTPSVERREEKQAHSYTGTARGVSQGAVAKRFCKACRIEIGKGKQLCVSCKATKKRQLRTDEVRERERIALRLKRGSTKESKWKNPEKLHFRRDSLGNVTEKFCTCCETWKPAENYGKRKDTPTGVDPWCKPCVAHKRKEWDKNRKPVATKIAFCENNECGKCFPVVGNSKFCSDECRRLSARRSQRIKNGSVTVSTTALCRRCGEIKPLHQFKKRQADFGCKPTACNECQSKNKKRHKAINAKKPKNKPRQRLSTRFRKVMNKVKNGGNHCFRDVIGCSTAFLRKHLESQFTRGIRWSNYGTKWHVDHILPVSSFDHSDPNQVAKCWHYSNLRPLCAIKNNLKSNHIETCQPELLLQLVESQ